MKSFITICLIFCSALAFSATQRYRLMFNDDPATTITIAWEQISGTNAEVYYDVVDHGADWTQYPNSATVYKTTNYMGMTSNFAKLTSLSPNTAYYFVIKDSEGTSFTDSYWFKTCPDDNTEPLSFVSGGDSRSGQTQRQNSNKMVGKIRPHAVLFGGDLVNTPGNTSVQTWFDDWQLHITSDRQMIPMVHSFGNHEEYGTGGAEFIEQLFDTPYDVYYNVKFGGDLFSMYTLNGELLPGHTIANGTKRTQQANWLATELPNDNSIWKAAQYHRPIVPHFSGKGEGADEFDDWANLFYDYGVRLVMESDAHVTKITEEVKPAMTTASGNSSNWFTTSGLNSGQGITFTGEGAWGTIRTPDDLHPFTTAATSMYHFTWIVVDQCKIELRTIDTQSPSTVPEHTINDIFSVSAGLDAQIWKPAGLPSGVKVINKFDNLPEVDFLADNTNIFEGATVNFTDLSTNTPTSWNWAFGDGGNATNQNPSYIYNTAGTYSVTLEATNGNGSCTQKKTDYINVASPTPPVTDFVADDVTPSVTQTVNFTDLSSGNPDSWSWNFGDGNTSTVQHPSHAYTASGTYTVSLTSTNTFGSDIETKTAYIDVTNGGSVSATIATGNDDVEEFNSDGSLYFTSSDLEFCYDGGNVENQHVGLRFQNIQVPQGATISNAHLIVRADENDGTNVDIYMHADDNDNSAAWSGNSDVSIRPNTTATITWSFNGASSWSSGTVYQSPDISNIIQEVVDRAGWNSGNSLSLILTDNGTENDERVADSYEGGYPAEIVFDWSIPNAPAPVASFTQNSTSICEGSIVDFTDQSTNGPTSWSWDFGDGNSSTAQNPTHTYNTAGTYTVQLTATNSGGSDIVTMNNLITVLANPNVDAGGNQAICSGESITINATGANTYAWDQGLGTGASHTVSPTMVTMYTVTGTGSNGCTATDQITVTVNGLPAVDAGTDQDICSGASATISANGASTYTWDNSLGAGSNHTVSPSGTTTYTVTGIDANGCENTDQITVNVNALPTVDAGSDQDICDGSSIVLSGSGASTYAWDNGVTDGATFTPSSTTTYTVTGTDVNGCENTDQVTVTVNSLPTIEAGSNAAICSGDNVTLSGSGANTYVWDNGVTDGTAFTPTSTATYTVTGTDNIGCENTDQVTITVDNPNNPGTANPISVCDQNTSVDLGLAISGEDAGGTWTDDDGTGALAGSTLNATSLTAGNTYNFTYEVPSNGACPAQQVTTQVTVSGTVEAGTPTANNEVCSSENAFDLYNSITGYTTGGTWSDDDATGQLSGSSVDGTGLTAGTYSFTYSIDGGTCGTDTQTIQITISTPPTVSTSGDTEICNGDNATLTASGATSYNWDNGLGSGASQTVSPTTSTTYTVTGTEGVCTATDQITVNVNDLPAVTLDSFMVDTLCRTGGQVTLPSGSPSGGTYSGSGVSGLNFDAQTAGNGSHDITYTFTDVNGCSNTAVQTIVVVECLGIADNDKNIFNIYPNPANDYVIIERDNPSEFSQIKIYDMNGKLVYNENVADNPLEISVQDWERGTYSIMFTNKENKTITKKIVLQ